MYVVSKRLHYSISRQIEGVLDADLKAAEAPPAPPCDCAGPLWTKWGRRETCSPLGRGASRNQTCTVFGTVVFV